MSEKTEQVNKSAKPPVFERLWLAVVALRRVWFSSLRLRVIVLIVCGGVLGAGVTGMVITSQIRSVVFQQTVQSNVEQFTSEVRVAQEKFSATASTTAGQTQQIANELVARMYDPVRGLMGAVLMRSAKQSAPQTTQIIEPSTASVATLRSLVTNQLRESVASTGDVAWQSVAITRDSPTPVSASIPGIVVGRAIDIPRAGAYELYAVYSLENQESLLNSTYRVLSFGVVALIILVTLLIIMVLQLVLRPVREASEGARHLAEGELETRMEVQGSDELAQLANSFNQMASSLEEQFARLERMSAVQTAFVSAVSHELRSPVTTIRMAGQLIYDKREELPLALKRSAELQHDQLKNLDSMLSDLLEISRYDAGAMNLASESTDISSIVQNVVTMVQPLANDNGVLVSCVAQGDTRAEVEPRRIERIMRNLIVNAVEHGEAKPVRIRVVGNNSAVAVEVADNGVGLSHEQAAHVFDRFWRADSSRMRKTGGTGLGLTIAREDALMHGGSLSAVGELGVGSTFLLAVPKKPGASYVSPIALQLHPYLSIADGTEDIDTDAVSAAATGSDADASNTEDMCADNADNAQDTQDTPADTFKDNNAAIDAARYQGAERDSDSDANLDTTDPDMKSRIEGIKIADTSADLHTDLVSEKISENIAWVDLDESSSTQREDISEGQMSNDSKM